jgi:hypothetical protein
MSIQKFPSTLNDKKIAYCMVDDTHTYNPMAREYIKNIADYTITNLYSKGYDTFVGLSENELLKQCANDYEYCVVFSPGTEFINGDKFFTELESYLDKDFFIMGHILDRNEAYYELHHQCYVINLKYYKQYNCPDIGKQILGSKHRQTKPHRSNDNIHDDYTPSWVSGGEDETDYSHKMHGHNILSIAFDNDIPVLVFDEPFRQNKKHYYPENIDVFLDQINYIYQKHNYCLTTFVHTENTDWPNSKLTDIEQVFTPASGTWYTDIISKTKPVHVVMYDYNIKALEYWKNKAPVIANVSYDFVHLDLLNEIVDLHQYFDYSNKKTVFNLSNIFAYEGRISLYPLRYRLHRENYWINNINKCFPDSYITFSSRATTGFIHCPLYGQLSPIDISQLNTPSWHMYGDWV